MVGTSNPIDDFRGEYRWLSNFGADTFVWRGVWWKTSEHAYQAAKTDDPAAFAAIRAAATAGEARRMGQAVRLRDSWEDEKLGVMREVVTAKFEQNPVLVERLLATGDRPLIEGTTWHDNFWGTCRCSRCGDRGRNELGKLLEELRARFIATRSDAGPATVRPFGLVPKEGGAP